MSEQLANFWITTALWYCDKWQPDRYRILSLSLSLSFICLCKILAMIYVAFSWRVFLLLHIFVDLFVCIFVNCQGLLLYKDKQTRYVFRLAWINIVFSPAAYFCSFICLHFCELSRPALALLLYRDKQTRYVCRLVWINIVDGVQAALQGRVRWWHFEVVRMSRRLLCFCYLIFPFTTRAKKGSYLSTRTCPSGTLTKSLKRSAFNQDLSVQVERASFVCAFTPFVLLLRFCFCFWFSGANKSFN